MNSFESRTGTISYGDEVIYRFVTDIRNFERFIPRDSVKNWQATTDSCTFEIPYAGKTGFSIIQKEPFSEVHYSGSGLGDTKFFFKILIIKEADNKSEVKVLAQADLNPMINMIVSKPIVLFLEKLIDEMEKFNGWAKAI